jgi:hypothetical protein
MNKYETNKMKPLNGEDRERMGRLFEEITGRVQEISAMMHRLHGTSLHWTKFEISSSGTSSGTDVPILVAVCNEETGDCGCYDHEAGTSGPCPELPPNFP